MWECVGLDAGRPLGAESRDICGADREPNLRKMSAGDNLVCAGAHRVRAKDGDGAGRTQNPMTDPYVLHRGDCLAILQTLPDASVDALVTDPPYSKRRIHPRRPYGAPR